jgi:hypothetical protein
MLKKIVTNPFFVFPVVTCIVFWPLSFCLLSLKNDALTFYYPVRTLISDALHNGELPLWTPFINMGYPLHADLQSGAWNPITWLFALLTDYSLAAFHYEMLFYVSFAGIGFYYLCREYGADRALAFSLAFAFQFCGFLTDSVQFFTCISSACCLPFVFLFVKRTLYLYRWQDAIYAGCALFLFFTGGYPALFIITGYLVAAFVIFVLLSTEDKWRLARKIIPLLLLTLGAFVLLALPAILSFVDYLPLIKRGAGISLAVAEENPMHPYSLLSAIAPFANTANEFVLSSSVLMQNIYFGIIPFVFLIFLLICPGVRIPKQAWFFLAGAVFFLLLSWGGFFFLHRLAYSIIPFFNSSRHPGLLRLPALFLLLLAINITVKNWLLAGRPGKTLLLKTAGALFIILLAAGIILIAMKNGRLFSGLSGSLSNATNFKSLYFSERYLVQLPVVLGLLLLLYRAISKEWNFYWITLLVIADMLVNVQLLMPVTILGARRMDFIEAHLQRNPEKFPVPGTSSIIENSTRTEDSLLITGSMLPFTKKIGRNDYFITPGNLLLQDSFYSSPIKKIVFNNPVLYMADTMIDNQFIPVKNGGIKTAPLYTDLQKTKLTTASTPYLGKIRITGLSANSLVARLDPSVQGALVLLQNNYPGWRAFIDGKEQKIESVNISFMAVEVPPGSRDLRFIYRPAKLVNASYITLFGLIGILAIIISDLFAGWRAAKHQRGI